MTNEPVDTAPKERRCQAYHTTSLPRHNVCLDLINGKLHYHSTSITVVNHCYVQRIVRATSPQSMNIGGVVQKLWTISVMQGQ